MKAPYLILRSRADGEAFIDWAYVSGVQFCGWWNVRNARRGLADLVPRLPLALVAIGANDTTHLSLAHVSLINHQPVNSLAHFKRLWPLWRGHCNSLVDIDQDGDFDDYYDDNEGN